MNESDFHAIADRTLDRLADALEEADAKGALDVECESGVITIGINGKQFIVSKHTASRQIWLSSPVSGGLHFSYQDGAKHWALADGRTLENVLAGELKTFAALEVAL